MPASSHHKPQENIAAVPVHAATSAHRAGAPSRRRTRITAPITPASGTSANTLSSTNRLAGPSGSAGCPAAPPAAQYRCTPIGTSANTPTPVTSVRRTPSTTPPGRSHSRSANNRPHRSRTCRTKPPASATPCTPNPP
ncbi:hypothetical protein ACFQ9X_55615 [Catenulispora yoronensis]